MDAETKCPDCPKTTDNPAGFSVGPRVRTFAERNPVPTEFVAGILDPDETDEDDTVLVPEEHGGEARV